MEEEASAGHADVAAEPRPSSSSWISRRRLVSRGEGHMHTAGMGRTPLWPMKEWPRGRVGLCGGGQHCLSFHRSQSKLHRSSV